MAFENLTIGRVCLHEIHRRADDRNIVPPTFSSQLLNLDARGRGVFQSRVLSAFRSGAKCMQMDIAEHGAGSVSALGAAITTASDEGFVDDSRQFAHLLAGAQTSRQYPGGLVVVFDGTVGHPATRFFGIMKAEMHEAFLKRENLQATFVDSVFLSPKTKLYKIGLFVANDLPTRALPGGWTAMVYDSQLTAAERDGAALYFHGNFLGLAFPQNSAYQTKKFYEKTREFISGAAISEEEKVGLYNSLYTYLKLDRSPTLQTGRFAESYMEEGLADQYREHMQRERFPDIALAKDISEIAGRMRTRKLKFRDQITLSGPAQAIAEFVEVDTIDAPGGGVWTRITVHGRLESQQ